MHKEFLQNRLLKAIKKLNMEENGKLYSLDPDKYNLEEIKESIQKQYKCKFVEKETNRKIEIEIKVIM